MSDDQYSSAIPYFEEYITRMKEVEDPRVQAIVQEARLKLGKVLIYLEDYKGAAEDLKQ